MIICADTFFLWGTYSFHHILKESHDPKDPHSVNIILIPNLLSIYMTNTECLSSVLQSSRIWLVSDRKEINILALSVIFFFFLHENSRLSCSLKWNKTNQTKKNSKGTFKFLDQIQSNYFMWSNL